MRNANIPYVDSNKIQLALDLAKHSWFYRMWTIQELANAKSPLAWCGKHSAKFHNLALFLVFLTSESTLCRESTMHLFAHIRFRTVIGYSRLKGGGANMNLPFFNKVTDLIELMDTVRICGATEPKDKIFALYGLFAEIGVRLPSPDYKKSLGTIYLEATKALIEKETSLRILLLVTGLPNSDIEAPSWVPDFSNDLPPYPVFEQTDISATLDTTAIYTFASSGQKLCLRGRIIDRISWSSSLQIWHPDHVLRPSENILVEALRSGPSAQVKTIHALQDWALKARMVTPRLNGQVWE